MKVAHVRERHAPAGTPFRLAAALDPAATEWLDLEVARRRIAAADPRRPHDGAAVPTADLDARRPSGRRPARRRARRARSTTSCPPRRTTRRSSTRSTSPSARRSSDRPACATSTPSNATSRRCGHAAAARSPRPGTGCRSSTSATSRRSAGRASPSGPRAAASSSTSSSRSARSSTRPARDLPADRAEEAIGGYTILNDWSARDLQRDETTVRLGPAKGKDFAVAIGPWLVTPDELGTARAPELSGPDLAMTVDVVTATAGSSR